MKTTVDIPENELKQAMKFTGAKTKREAIVAAVSDYNRRQRLARITKMFGTFDNFITLEELKKLREES